MKKILLFVWLASAILCSCDKKETEVPPSIETVSFTLIDASKAKVTGVVNEAGSLPVTDYGFVYGFNYYPTIESGSGTKVSLGKTPPTGNVTGEIPVSAGNRVYVRMYLVNSKGTAYGKVLDVDIPYPNIAGITPSSAKVGASVEIRGNNFSLNAADYKVRFGNVQARVISVTPNLLTVEVPDCSAYINYGGRVYIYVSIGAQEIWYSSDFILLPTITGYSPKNGSFGTTITITGSGFIDSYYYDRYVNFGNVQTYYTYVNSTTIKVDVPSGINNTTVAMKLNVNGVNEEIGQFSMDSPVIESFSPETGVVGLTKLQVNGRNFNSSGNILKVGDVELTSDYYSENNSVKVARFLPNTITSGSYDVKVFNGIEWATAASKINLIAPAVTAISPASGYAGSKITFTGNFFNNLKDCYSYCYLGNNNSIYLDNVVVTSIDSQQQQITLTVPDMASGTYKISFYLDPRDYYSPDVNISTTLQFTILPPSITGFNPVLGVAGDIVTITGINLRNCEVYFGTTQGKILSISPTEIKVQVPSGIDGKMKISILSYGKTVVSNDDFTALK